MNNSISFLTFCSKNDLVSREVITALEFFTGLGDLNVLKNIIQFA